MSLMDNIKNHINNNKVKYGIGGAAAAGIGAGTLLANNKNIVGNTIDQALYNAGVYGARGVDKFGNAIGVPTLSNGLPNVSPEEQEAANRMYNMELPNVIRPEVGQILGASKEFIHESSGLMESILMESILMDKIVNILNESVNMNSPKNRNTFFRRAIRLAPEHSLPQNAGFIGGGVGTVVGAGLGSAIPLDTENSEGETEDSNVPEAVGAIAGALYGANKFNKPAAKQAMANMKTDLYSTKIINRVAGNSTDPLSTQDRIKVLTASRLVAGRKAAMAARKRALDAQPDPTIIPPVQIG